MTAKEKISLELILLLLLVVTGHNTGLAQELNGSFESKFKRYQKNENFSGTTSLKWNTVAWKGDRIHKQLLLWSDTNIDGLSYSISDLVNGEGQIEASNIKLRFGQSLIELKNSLVRKLTKNQVD